MRQKIIMAWSVDQGPEQGMENILCGFHHQGGDDRECFSSWQELEKAVEAKLGSLPKAYKLPWAQEIPTASKPDIYDIRKVSPEEAWAIIRAAAALASRFIDGECQKEKLEAILGQAGPPTQGWLDGVCYTAYWEDGWPDKAIHAAWQARENPNRAELGAKMLVKEMMMHLRNRELK